VAEAPLLFRAEGGEIGRLLHALREQPDAAEMTAGPSLGDAVPSTLFVTGSDREFEAVLIACADARLLRSVAQRIEARLQGGG
jgi:hypothetical protein